MNSSALSLALSQPQQSQKALGDAYLKFQLNQQTLAVLPMKHVQEALALPPRRLTPMPNMPACVLGLMNQRSKVMWVVDLAHILRLSTHEPHPQQYNIITVRVGQIPLGLAVRAVEGITRLMPDWIQPPIAQTSLGLVPYLRGCVVRPDEVLLVLDAEAILHSSVLHSH